MLLDFLRGKQRDEEECAALCRRLGEWHLARREYRTAYGYLFRAGEKERILALLDNEDTITSDSAAFDGVSDMFSIFRYWIDIDGNKVEEDKVIPAGTRGFVWLEAVWEEI